jgi:peptidoglycan DL-endopeptidase CwlO
LTSQAWQHGGGKWITRTSRSQYVAVGKIPYSQMRPGDLIFYGDDPGSIWHVAIYAGGGMMIEAPRTGLQVRRTAVRMSGAMRYAGRP